MRGHDTRATRRLLVALAFALAALPAHAERVLRVIDGDSLRVDSHGKEAEIRLVDIDAPEYKQRGGPRARAALLALVGGRDVDLELRGGDTYHRILAEVFVDGRSVNEAMVREGHAWVREAYDPPKAWVRLQREAREARRGLWADPDPTPPWIWRKQNPRKPRRSASAEAPPRAPGPIPRVECGTKTWCSEMTSCEEAIAHLKQCHLDTIDGDHDGIPCEKLCRYYR